MISHPHEIYSDQSENENVSIELVRQLGENEKTKSENVNQLEQLLRKSRQLNSSNSLRLIDQQIENLPTKINQSIENLILSCNLLGKNYHIDSNQLPNHLKYLELSGNFLSTISQIENDKNKIESLGLSFNEIDQIFSHTKWSNLCSIDLSYNILNDLKKTIQSLENLNKLRILFLHGNPISLLVDYRVYVVDSLQKLVILDDITITTEERFRARTFATSDQHPKDYSQFKISFGNLTNIPQPPPNESEWPIRVHRYKMRLDWFEGIEHDVEIPFDKMGNFKRFNQTQIESSTSDYKPTIDFSPNYLDFSINTLLPFRDFLFHGTTSRFIHQMTEYWPPGEPNEGNDQKKKSNATADKKSDSPVKKKKTEDLNKLVTRKDPIETILAEFHVDLRPFLDGDYQVLSQYKCLLQQQIDSNNQQIIKPKSPKKKELQKNDSQDKKRTESSKSNKDKQKDKNENELPPLPEPFQCSIQFQLQRFIAKGQII